MIPAVRQTIDCSGIAVCGEILFIASEKLKQSSPIIAHEGDRQFSRIGKMTEAL
jgi:hypothetical protein